MTFTEFKKDFYSRITDFTIFDCQDFNLLKVVLEGLRVNYKYPIKADFLLSPYAYKIKYTLKHLRANLQGSKIKDKLKKYEGRIVMGFSSRTFSPDHKNVSLYFENIFRSIGRENAVYISDSVPADISCSDLRLNDIIAEFSALKATVKELKLAKDLRTTFENISDSKLFSDKELTGIRNAFQIFLVHFKAWDHFLSRIKPPLALFEQHYHREGFLLACRRNNIKAIELQHGLIVPEDIFYVFPPETKKVISKALFADEIFVYGEYWKNNLLKGVEYPAEKIKTLGYYHYEPSELKTEIKLKFADTENLILITTQTNISDFYINYIKTLSDLLLMKHADWNILVKIHPSEKADLYAQVDQLPNCQIVQTPVAFLFDKCKIHISIYSTTLYDARRYNILNFSVFYEKYGDYCRRITDEGIAFNLDKTDDPVEYFLNGVKTTGSSTLPLYEKYNETLLLSVNEPL